MEENLREEFVESFVIDDEDSSRETSDDLAVGGRLRDLSSSPITIPADEDEDNDSSRHGNIRAQRLIQSIKRIKKADGGALFWEGWMIHTTDKDLLTEKKYYWRVDASYVHEIILDKNVSRKTFLVLSQCITMKQQINSRENYHWNMLFYN